MVGRPVGAPDLGIAAALLAVLGWAGFDSRFQAFLPVVRRGVNTTGVGLTFDDGPDPKGTPVVLDTLDRFGVNALFFLVG
jgi:peptidoglycan/xylan/chitin deacetylase (PgdA/CDA1 family)